MTEKDPLVKHLPSDPLPEGAPRPKIKDTEHIEVFSVGNESAVLVVAHRKRETLITQPWVSTRDDDFLAQQLVRTIRSLYIEPDKPVAIQVDASQTALHRALRGQGAVISSQVMTKPVDSNNVVPAPAGDVHPRDMNDDEVESFLAATEDEFARSLLENSADPSDWDGARAKSRGAFEAVVPEGGRTPGHLFLVIEDDEGEKVALLWVALDAETKQSYCYKIEVEAAKRRLGFGRKTVAIWEGYAVGQGAVSMGLNVFGNNLAAQGLYVGAGFTVATTLFRAER
ncbi:hypothetical protein VPNG_07853 [Cytospora leucostoma]|uniref:N-acetyltransferase domain-containing protein n=1 Tax=Cytospora leucostoma TaxID=1230097 RepID=A0A423WGU8_9PEZI|nr:hypothetical protein VPNG_07853 [Cytospora leucostoma]